MNKRSASKQTAIGYVAFLRGINVGGHKVIKMGELKTVFESLGFRNVTTVLASGNVRFECPRADSVDLTARIESALEKAFGHEVGVILRSIQQVEELAVSEPFGKIKVTADTRLYVTFLPEKAKITLKPPHDSPDKNFKIVSASHGDVCSVLTVSPGTQSTDLMSFLEKKFGKKMTTRNWNTIGKILKKSS